MATPQSDSNMHGKSWHTELASQVPISLVPGAREKPGTRLGTY